MNNIYINTPGTEDVSKMKRCGNTLHCTHCNKNVTDLTKASTPVVNAFITAGEASCVILHKRHESTEKQRFNWINQTETFLLRWRLKKIAFILTSLLLLLSSCFSCRPHHLAGAWSKNVKHQINQHKPNEYGKESHQ